MGMLDLSVLGAPLLGSLCSLLPASPSWLQSATCGMNRRKVWFIFLPQTVVVRCRAAWQLSLDSPDCIP